MFRLQRPAGVFVFALLSAFATHATHARAQSSMEEPQTIDAARATIRGSTRVIGLGGAFVAIADDTQGVSINPASVAVRLPYSWDPFSFAFGIDISIATWLPKNDVFNVPQATGESRGGSLFGSFAILTNYQHAGFGLSAEAEQNVATSKAQQGVSTKLTANFGVVRPAVAYGYFDGQLQLGAGLRVLGFSIGGSQGTPLTAGIGYTAGVIVKPKGQQFRVGAAIEQPINAQVPSDNGATPTLVHVPWTAAFGFAYQFGKRRMNPKFVTISDRVRRNTAGQKLTGEARKKAEEVAAKELFDEYQKDQTWYLLVSSELALIQGSGNVALGGGPTLSRTLVSPRLGVESEVVPRHLRVRAGTYLELATTPEGHARMHVTGGVDIRLFEWSVFGLVKPFDYWQLSLAADGASSYLNTSFSIGFWH
ncbi:MAG TPA: hypothetical protein VJV79_07475 [Polyangiaceae bacterium]|nr:hypothetical protein [Polyangiaceae bacterium]